MLRVTKHPGKTPAQRRALDEIGCGNHSPIMAKSTQNALLGAGLITEMEPGKLSCGNLGFITVRQFDMPIPVHIQWCEAMSDAHE